MWHAGFYICMVQGLGSLFFMKIFLRVGIICIINNFMSKHKIFPDVRAHCKHLQMMCDFPLNLPVKRTRQIVRRKLTLTKFLQSNPYRVPQSLFATNPVENPIGPKIHAPPFNQ